MEKILELAGCKIKIGLSPEIIRVYSNRELWRFLDKNIEIRMEMLADQIKTAYVHNYGKPLKISDSSLIVEILAHVYCDYMGLLFNRTVKVKFLQKLMEKLLKRAEVIDCGERKKDGNRWVWDILVRFKSLFLKIMPKELHQTGLKKY